MEWIKITEKKPKDDETVLVIHNKMKTIPMVAYYDEQEDVFLCIQLLNTCPLLITHWMSLPESPED